MKRVKEFFKKHIRKIVLGIFILIAITHFIVNFEILQNTKLMEESWINFINGYILILTMTFGSVFLIWLVFFMTKDAAKDLEKFLLENLTTACFLIIFYLVIKGKDLNLENSYILTAIGAVIVFWYGYKRYERDKELEMIDRYNKGEFSINSFDDNLDKISHVFHLNEMGYFPKYVWKKVDHKIEEKIIDFLEKNLKGTTSKEILDGGKVSNTLSRIKYDGEFMDYFIGKLEDYVHTTKNHELSEEEKGEQKKIIGLIIEIRQLLNPKNN